MQQPYLKTVTGPINVGDALDVIAGKDCWQTHVEFAGVWRSLLEMRKLFEELNGLTAEAEGIKVMFWGGPPGKETWHKGSLRCFMLDSIFRDEAYNQQYDMLIDFAKESRSRQRVKVKA